MLPWLSIRVWQILNIAGGANKVEGAFFIQKPTEVPRGFFHVALLNAITSVERKSEFIKLLAEDNGGGNCLMQTSGAKKLEMRTLSTRRTEFETEFHKTPTDKTKCAHLRGAQFM